MVDLPDATLANSRCLASTITQVIEPGATHPAPGYELNLFDSWVVQGESLFNADTMGNFAHGVRCVHCASFAFNNNTLKNLDTLLAPLDDTDMDLNCIARAKLGMILAHLFLVDFVNNCTHGLLFIESVKCFSCKRFLIVAQQPI